MYTHTHTMCVVYLQFLLHTQNETNVILSAMVIQAL